MPFFRDGVSTIYIGKERMKDLRAIEPARRRCPYERHWIAIGVLYLGASIALICVLASLAACAPARPLDPVTTELLMNPVPQPMVPIYYPVYVPRVR